jgi:proteasome accessory factor C
MSQKSIDQLERLISLLPFLQVNQGISISDLAHRFQVSEKTMEQDLSLLFLCGLPGYSHLELIDLAFEDGYVFVKDAQNLNRPNQLSQNQIASAILALKILEQNMSNNSEIKTTIQSLIGKLTPLNTDEILEIKNAESSAQILELIEVVQQSLKEDLILQGEYRSDSADTLRNREFKPTKLYRRESWFYVDGIEVDNELKTFRLDRFSFLSLVQNFSKPTTQEKDENPLYSGEIKVRGLARALPVEHPLLDLKLIDSQAGAEIYSFHGIRGNWLIRESFYYGGELEILAPLSLRAKIHSLAENALLMG